jgi:uncharacterized membrane protein
MYMTDNTKTSNIEAAPETPKEKAFKYQLDILKVEIDTINKTIARCDEHTRATRNWAIVTWAGSIALGLGSKDLRQYIILTVVLPILFWLIDARWTSVLRAFLFRQNKISEFLNDSQFSQSFEQKQLIGFKLLDPKGRQYKSTTEYKQYVNFWGAMTKYAEVSVLYIGLALISIGVGLFFIIVR